MKNVIQFLLAKYDNAKVVRRNYEPMWQDISDYVLPNRGDFVSRVADGDNSKRKNIFDTTGEQANNLLASSLFGGLTSPSSKWFSLKLKDIKGFEESIVSERFMENAVDEMLDIFNSSESGFTSQVHEYFLSLTSYGTAALYIEDLPGEQVKFCTVHLSEITILENKVGMPDTVFREFKMSVRQIAQKWGEDVLNNQLRKLLETDPERKIGILHCVLPSEDVKGNTKKFKFHSYYINLDHNQILSEGGYYEQPYVIARFSKLAGEHYGRSPAWSSLPDVRMVNAMKETLIRSSQLAAAPPMLLADDGVMSPLKITPNGIIMGGLSMDGMERVRPLNMGGNLAINENIIQQTQKSIRDMFYIDAFIFRDQAAMTATEARLRQQEQLRLLAPHIGRIQSEFLFPLIDKVFNILLRRGILGAIPKELNGRDWSVEYVSPLALLQKSQDVQAIQNFLAMLLPLSQVNPAALDVVNFDKAIETMAINSGVPLSVIRAGSELEEIRRERSQAQSQQMLLNQGQQAADIMSKLPQ
jgi:hypothetical protein